jgi:exodeoxyribonuclease VII small subunit
MGVKKDYSDMQNELNEIVNDLQSGNIDVDDAMKKYDRGQELVKEISEYLKNAENKITKINK